MNRIISVLSLLIIFILLVSAASTNAQGLFLDRGRNGIRISGTFSHGQGLYVIGGSFGISLAALIDLNLAISRLKVIDFDAKFLTVAPQLTVYALKQTKLIPISMAASISYEIISANRSEGYNTSDIKSLNYGIALYRSFHLSEGGQFIPEVGIVYTDPMVKNSDLENITSFLIGFIYVAPGRTEKRIFVNPSILINKDNRVVNIALGMYLSKSSPR
ncbi:MAG: hypothetical protein GY839_20780 [candidate division Zixibacteria bacterium]|nr:hypothetical protein [candidate division Zixibacteria bacterium]